MSNGAACADGGAPAWIAVAGTAWTPRLSGLSLIPVESSLARSQESNRSGMARFSQGLGTLNVARKRSSSARLTCRPLRGTRRRKGDADFRMDSQAGSRAQIHGAKVSGGYPLLARLARLAPDGKTGTSGQTGTKWVALRPGSFAHTHPDNPRRLGRPGRAQEGTETVPGWTSLPRLPGVRAATGRLHAGADALPFSVSPHTRDMERMERSETHGMNRAAGALRRKINRECPEWHPSSGMRRADEQASAKLSLNDPVSLTPFLPLLDPLS